MEGAEAPDEAVARVQVKWDNIHKHFKSNS